MKRIFPPHAYGEVPREASYWPSTMDPPINPPARGTLTADVAIIGAGFTGLSAALHLAQDGADVIVLEANDVGWGASGRNGGFCCLGGAAASAVGASLCSSEGLMVLMAWVGVARMVVCACAGRDGACACVT